MATRINHGRLVIEDVPQRAYPPFLANGEGDCLTYPLPNDFTDESSRLDGRAARDRALVVCAGCPLRVPCREWAMATNQPGVWGGTTTAERERLRAEVVAGVA